MRIIFFNLYLLIAFSSCNGQSTYTSFRNYSNSIERINQPATLNQIQNVLIGLQASNLHGIGVYNQLAIGAIFSQNANTIALKLELDYAGLHPLSNSFAACARLVKGLDLGVSYSLFYPSLQANKLAYLYQFGISQQLSKEWQYSTHFTRYIHLNNEYANQNVLEVLMSYKWNEYIKFNCDFQLAKTAKTAFGLVIQQGNAEYQICMLSNKALQLAYARDYKKLNILLALQSHFPLGLSPTLNLQYED